MGDTQSSSIRGRKVHLTRYERAQMCVLLRSQDEVLGTGKQLFQPDAAFKYEIPLDVDMYCRVESTIHLWQRIHSGRLGG